MRARYMALSSSCNPALSCVDVYPDIPVGTLDSFEHN